MLLLLIVVVDCYKWLKYVILNFIFLYIQYAIYGELISCTCKSEDNKIVFFNSLFSYILYGIQLRIADLLSGIKMLHILKDCFYNPALNHKWQIFTGDHSSSQLNIEPITKNVGFEFWSASLSLVTLLIIGLLALLASNHPEVWIGMELHGIRME